MKVVILCGGYGTRIRGVADDIPKPMIPIGNHPILWNIMKYYSCFGHKDFVLCLGYKSEVIKDYFVNYRQRVSNFTIFMDQKNIIEYFNEVEESEWAVTLVETGMNSMTGARIKAIEAFIGDDETFMLTYGDGVGDIDIGKLLEFHRQHGKIMTVTGVQPPGRFGEMTIANDGIALGFNEKPQSSGGYINGGFFVCNRKLFEYLDDSESLVFEKGPVESLVKDGQLMVYRHEGFWQPMDTYREYQLLNDLYSKGKAPWVIW